MKSWYLPLVLSVALGWLAGSRCVARPPSPRAAVPERLPLPAIRAALDACGSAILANRAEIETLEQEINRVRAQASDLRCVATHQWERAGKPVAILWPWSPSWGEWAQCDQCGQGYACNRAKEQR